MLLRLIDEKGWTMKRDPRGGWRRVVPSPKPIKILEGPIINYLIDQEKLLLSLVAAEEYL